MGHGSRRLQEGHSQGQTEDGEERAGDQSQASGFDRRRLVQSQELVVGQRLVAMPAAVDVRGGPNRGVPRQELPAPYAPGAALGSGGFPPAPRPMQPREYLLYAAEQAAAAAALHESGKNLACSI